MNKLANMLFEAGIFIASMILSGATIAALAWFTAWIGKIIFVGWK